MESYIETRKGTKFDLLNPKEDDLDIKDIAYSLSNQSRFNGHTRFYSVAEHSVYCAAMVKNVYKVDDNKVQLAALLHDAAEAFIGDIPSPVKQYLPEIKKMEDNILKVIMKKYKCWKQYQDNHDTIKKADVYQLKTEAQALLPSKGLDWELWKEYSDDTEGIIPYCATPLEAYRGFMDTYEVLTKPLIML